MGAIMGAWGQIYEVYDWVCAHVPLLHWEHNYHGGHYRVCSHVRTQSWGYSMALARWSNVTHGTQPQIHRAIGIFLGMVSTNFTHLWWNWGWLMIGFTRLNQCQNSWKTANAALQRHMMQPPASNAPTRFQQAWSCWSLPLADLGVFHSGEISAGT